MMPSELLRDQVAREAREKLGVHVDSALEHRLLEPSIGFVDADGAAYVGYVDAPPSPSFPVEFLLESATNGVATVLVEVVTDAIAETPEGGSSPYPIFSLADGLLTRFEWPRASP